MALLAAWRDLGYLDSAFSPYARHQPALEVAPGPKPPLRKLSHCYRWSMPFD